MVSFEAQKFYILMKLNLPKKKKKSGKQMSEDSLYTLSIGDCRIPGTSLSWLGLLRNRTDSLQVERL